MEQESAVKEQKSAAKEQEGAAKEHERAALRTFEWPYARYVRRREKMHHLINIPIYITVFEDLCNFLDGSKVTEHIAAVASKAITAWIEQQSLPPPEDSLALLGGYQWKQLFLPEGTKLRIVIKHKTFHAAIVGDHIIFDGRAVSPAGLVNQLAATKRNAWKHIWLLFPGEKQWQSAQSMRE